MRVKVSLMNGHIAWLPPSSIQRTQPPPSTNHFSNTQNEAINILRKQVLALETTIQKSMETNSRLAEQNQRLTTRLMTDQTPKHSDTLISELITATKEQTKMMKQKQINKSTFSAMKTPKNNLFPPCNANNIESYRI